MTLLDDPPRFIVAAYGYVGPSILRQEIALAASFGRRQTTRWDYIVDTTHLRFANPLNLIWLRRIPRLPNLGNYIVIAPKRWTRILIALAAPFVRPTRVVRSLN